MKGSLKDTSPSSQAVGWFQRRHNLSIFPHVHVHEGVSDGQPSPIVSTVLSAVRLNSLQCWDWKALPVLCEGKKRGATNLLGRQRHLPDVTFFLCLVYRQYLHFLPVYMCVYTYVHTKVQNNPIKGNIFVLLSFCLQSSQIENTLYFKKLHLV